MKKRVFIMCAVLLFCAPLRAQSGKPPVKAVQAAVERAAKSGTERASASGALVRSSAAAEQAERGAETAARRAAQSAAVQAAGMRLREVEKHIKQSLFHIVSSLDGTTWGSGFVIEREGKIWGVASYHVTGRPGNTLRLRFYRADGSPVEYNGRVAASGSYGFNGADVSLISLPPEAAEHALPLKVSEAGPQKNALADSYGFPAEDFRPKDYGKHAGRRIVDVTGFKIITTVSAPGKESGACGGPLLNGEGEVIGVHSGSFLGKLGFASNAKPALDDLFKSLQTGGRAERELVFNGIKMLDININECVGLVLVRRGEETVFSRDFRRYPGSFDYRHLERVIPARPGDRITLYLQQGRQEVRLEFFTVPRRGAGDGGAQP